MIFTNSGPVVFPEDIVDVERILNLRFPLPLRKLYLLFNGGIPEPYVFEDENLDTVVTEFLPLKSEDGLTSVKLYKTLVFNRKLVPSHLYPFALEGGGDIFFVDTATYSGTVYFYRHDTADPEPLMDLKIGFDKFWSVLK